MRLPQVNKPLPRGYSRLWENWWADNLSGMDKFSPTNSNGSIIGAPIGPYKPSFKLERTLIKGGYETIAGVDEAGRGPLAGPVVAAAVILDPKRIPEGLDDSKLLSPKKRNAIYCEIIQNAHVAIASANVATIDTINIRQATLICMKRALDALELIPTGKDPNRSVDWCLFDGRDIPKNIHCNATAIIKGDGRSKSIGAASIVAKVVRDAIMVEASNSYPQYGFDKHKGYGTIAHMQAIKTHGPCPLHRMSFAPMKKS